jgi:uncharacterized repeat protein (TIGR03803 family)
LILGGNPPGNSRNDEERILNCNELTLRSNFLRPGIFAFAFCMLLGLAAGSQRAAAQTETVLYAFCSQPYCADGTTPDATLVMDSAGNLYGAAAGGSSQFYGGVVFEVNSKNEEESLVYDFAAIPQGVAPNGALARDTSGNLYGTTAGGGYDVGKCKKFYGCGVLYKLLEGSEQVLYTFLGGSDGQEPNGGLILDANGNIYGTTYRGGGNAARPGTVFEVSPSGVETILHRFAAYKGDGRLPSGGLVMDKKGNLYGTTSEGGVDGFYGPGLECYEQCGTVFEVTAAGVEKTLYSFRGSKLKDGASPFDSLILDKKGNLYGTTYAGGLYGYGTIFELTTAGVEKVLYSFVGQPDAGNPVGRLLLDAKGNLYGTTSFGGTFGVGAVFELSASGKESVLYSFTGGTDGASPFDGLVMDAAGNLYGTTEIGGNFGNSCPEGCGVVFKVVP